MATTIPNTPAEFPTLTIREAANADVGRIPVTRRLVMDAVEEVMLQEDRPSFRSGGALEEAGGMTSVPREESAGKDPSATGTPTADTG